MNRYLRIGNGVGGGSRRSAFAADIPLKAPPQPVYSGWGGWYVGVEVARNGDRRLDYELCSQRPR